MPTVSETTLAPIMPNSVPTSFGTITPSFERLLGYVDASAGPVGSRIVWKLYAISGGVRALAAISAPMPCGPKPYLIFAEPNEGVGRGVDMIAGTSYEIVGIPQDGNLTNIRAGFVGYDIEADTQPNEVVSSSQSLVFGQEVVFGSLVNHHVRVQVQVDTSGVAKAASSVRLYGTITGAAGPITVLIAEGVLTDNSIDPSIPINEAGLGFVTAQLRIESTNFSVGPGPITAVIVGADLNLDIGGGGGGGGPLIQFPNRLDVSVNKALVDNAQSSTPVMTVRTGTNAAGAFNGGGLGNKALLGVRGFDMVPLSALSTLEFTWQDLSNNPALGLLPYINLVVEVDPILQPGIFHIFVITLALVPTSVDAFTVTNLGGGRFIYHYDVVVNTIQVVWPGAVGLPPVVPVVNNGPAWFDQAFRMSDILAAYPNARLRDASSLDGGLPNATVTPSYLFVLGDSNNLLMCSRLLEQIKFNGVLV
ncbi:MAG: hypothetical protein ACYDH4_09960 [Candidatus Cryosericum sp.]